MCLSGDQGFPLLFFLVFWPASQTILGIFVLFLQAEPAKTAQIYISCERRRREECREGESPLRRLQSLQIILLIFSISSSIIISFFTATLLYSYTLCCCSSHAMTVGYTYVVLTREMAVAFVQVASCMDCPFEKCPLYFVTLLLLMSCRPLSISHEATPCIMKRKRNL